MMNTLESSGPYGQRPAQSIYNAGAAPHVAPLGRWWFGLETDAGLENLHINWSEETFKIFGLDSHQVTPSQELWRQLVHPVDGGVLKQKMLRLINDSVPYNYKCRIRRTDGQERYVQLQAEVERNKQGVALRVSGVILDITEQEETEKARRESEQHFRAVIESAPLVLWRLDADGQIIFAEGSALRLFGITPQNLVGQHAEALFADYEPLLQLSHQVLRGQSASGEVHIGDFIFEVRYQPQFEANGQFIGATGVGIDVTQREKTRQQLLESEERYALAVQGANDGLWDWDLIKEEIYLSPRWKQMVGAGEDEIGCGLAEWFERVHPEDLAPLQTQLKQHLAGQSAYFECEYRLRHANQTYRYMLGRGLAVRDAGGLAYRIAGSQTDLTARKQAELQLEINAFYDGLTGLPNRALFVDRLERMRARFKREPDVQFIVLFLDIDQFKKINDSLGHLAGDKLLVEASKRFESCVRPSDTIARFGGDEFAILVENVGGEHDVAAVAQRILHQLEQPFDLGGHEVFVTASIGIAPYAGEAEDALDLLRNADTAMYRAKGRGRSRYEIFDAEMHQRALRLLELETDMWHALERQEFCLHYQPIVDLNSGRIAGLEALVRWQHPQRGLMPPGEFVPLAEETGLIVPLGWWVLEEACRQAQGWNVALNSPQPLFMAVNLSSQQFSQSDMIERTQRILAETGFDANDLKLEITESVLMENTESAASMLRQLKEMGIQLSMDDFGTGYSSLSYLHRFPLDTLKIDRSFVSQMRPQGEGGVYKGEIVGTVLSLAEALQMQVVAEGVETPEQLQGLRSLGCDFAQGFHFSRPLAATAAQQLLLNQPSW